MNTAIIDTNPIKKPYKHRPTNKEALEATKHLKKATIKKVNEIKADFKKVDKPLLNDSPLGIYLKVGKLLHIYRRKERITATGLELLLFVYSEYLSTGYSVNTYSMAKQLVNKPDCSIEARNIRDKLNVLVTRGLLVRGGRNSQKAFLYFPTVKCIEDLQSIFTA